MNPDETPQAARILIVDDELAIREMLTTLLNGKGHDTTAAEDAETGLVRLAESPFDVVISDITMPGLSGIDLLNTVHDQYPDIPMILMTGNPNLETARAAIRNPAAVDYLHKPFDARTLFHTVDRAASQKRVRDENRRLTEQNRQYRLHLEEMVKEKSAELVKAYEEIAVSYDFTLEALVAMLDAREKATGQHSLRVRDLSLIVGRQMKLTEKELEHLARGTLLHDIGKIAIPDSILLKPGKLTDEEWKTMKAHVMIGHKIVQSSDYLAAAAQVILQHHEKFDGSGYPNGLKGHEICAGARIFSIIDAYDAMRSVRSYKNSIPKEEALEEIKRCSGSHFDPDVVDAFFSCLDEIEREGGWQA